MRFLSTSFYSDSEILLDKNRPVGELITILDCYVGHADGFAYKSYDRLVRTRKKGIIKPVGTPFTVVFEAHE